MWIRTIKGLKNPKKRIRVSLLILYDILVIGISEYTALLIRFEFHPGMIRKPFLESMIHYTPINIGCTLIIFALFSLYESLWLCQCYRTFKPGFIVYSISNVSTGGNVYDGIPSSKILLYSVFVGIITTYDGREIFV